MSMCNGKAQQVTASSSSNGWIFLVVTRVSIDVLVVYWDAVLWANFQFLVLQRNFSLEWGRELWQGKCLSFVLCIRVLL